MVVFPKVMDGGYKNFNGCPLFLGYISFFFFGGGLYFILIFKFSEHYPVQLFSTPLPLYPSFPPHPQLCINALQAIILALQKMYFAIIK